MLIDPVAIHVFVCGVWVGMLLLALGIWIADTFDVS